MSVRLRQCAGRSDFSSISDFLYSLYQPDNRDGNWFQPIWEDAKNIVGLVLYESYLGEAFFRYIKIMNI
ncbi:hypothetical protein GF312_11480 [Candidatus Poribacteria bacterium]|nr:hypothetical protein [Candidatus Poribacteria bacterium]